VSVKVLKCSYGFLVGVGLLETQLYYKKPAFIMLFLAKVLLLRDGHKVEAWSSYGERNQIQR